MDGGRLCYIWVCRPTLFRMASRIIIRCWLISKGRWVKFPFTDKEIAKRLVREFTLVGR